MKFVPIVMTSLLLISGIPAAASQAGWELIGERTVSNNTGREEIQTRPIVYASHLRLCATRQAIRFDGLDVQYRNGGTQQVSVGAQIPAGSCTHNIALSNRGGRDIDKVTLSYQASRRDGAAPRVLVFALADIVLR
jgi:hypothetical protein